MRGTQLILIVALMLCLMLACAGPPSLVTMTASIERAGYSEAQPVILTLTLHNNGTKRLMIGGSAFEQSSFRIIVRDGVGHIVARTAEGNRVLTPPTVVFANAIVLLNPGQTLRYDYNLAQLFDLSRTGDYTITASRRLLASSPLGGALRQQITLTSTPLKFHRVTSVSSIRLR